MTAKLHPQRGIPWVVRDYDAQVDFATWRLFTKRHQIPSFQSLQAEEVFVSSIHAEISIGCIETYVSDGNVVHVQEGGKADYP